MFPIFLEQDREAFFFIEEPESHLHPEWQTMLINTLQEFHKHTFFISTHSASFINIDTERFKQVLIKKR